MKSWLLWVLSVCLITVSLIADEPVKKEEATPRKIVEKFRQAIADKSRESVLALVAELDPKEKVGEELDQLLNADAARRKSSVFDEKIVGDLAVVIEGTEGKQYRTGVDLDPVFLKQVDGHWRIVWAPAAPVTAELILKTAKDKKQAENNLKELGRWFVARKSEIYSEREKTAKNR